MNLLDVKIQTTADNVLFAEVQARLNNLTKPVGSLGRLEDIVCAYCLAHGSADANLTSKRLFVFAGDHGITEEGVAPFPKEVTVQMVKNMLGGGAAVTVMARNADVDYRIIDMGVDGDFEPHPFLISRSIGRGTRNFRREAAMSEIECSEAINAGYELAADVDICAVGEMGIGNTSSASALYSLLLGVDPATTVGKGTGAVDKLLEHKRSVIIESVEFHRKEWDKTPFDALRRVGGFEIAGMTGFIIGSAAKRVPVVVDGFIATVAALCAINMCPNVKDYLFFGHASDEQFHKAALKLIDTRPILDLGMRLGEGTGAVLSLHIIEQALNCYHQMATFTSAGVAGKND